MSYEDVIFYIAIAMLYDYFFILKFCLILDTSYEKKLLTVFNFIII